MTAKKSTVSKAAAPRKAAPRRVAVKPPVELSGNFAVDTSSAPQNAAAVAAAVDDAARDLALDFLFKRAFKFGAAHHARAQVEMAKVPDEVKTVLYAVVDRNES